MIRGVGRKRGAAPTQQPEIQQTPMHASVTPAQSGQQTPRRRPGELLEQRARKAAMQVRRRVPKKKKVDVSAVIDRLVDELVDMEL